MRFSIKVKWSTLKQKKITYVLTVVWTGYGYLKRSAMNLTEHISSKLTIGASQLGYCVFCIKTDKTWFSLRSQWQKRMKRCLIPFPYMVFLMILILPSLKWMFAWWWGTRQGPCGYQSSAGQIATFGRVSEISTVVWCSVPASHIATMIQLWLCCSRDYLKQAKEILTTDLPCYM